MAVGEMQPLSTMALGELLGVSTSHGGETVIADVTLDSRQAGPGSLFIAIPGEVHDGRQFIEQAVANGCAAVVAEPPVSGFVDALPVPLVEVPDLRDEAGHIAARFFGYPARDVHTVGTTGTNGKTTTSHLIAQLNRALGRRCGVIGTLGSTLGDTVTEAVNTTPDAVSLQRQLASWRQEGVKAVSMEVSSHALVQGRVNGLEFATAIFTNLSHDHLDYHGSMAAYGRAKLKLFSGEPLGHAVINLDDAFAPQVIASVPAGVPVVNYSVQGGDADVRTVDTRYTADGARATLQTPWGTASLVSPLVGDFNLANLTAAIVAVVLSGQDLDAVVGAAAHLNPVEGRMHRIENSQGIQVLVDYAHTPDALAKVLTTVRPHVAGRLSVVFGCGGERDREKRQVMGRTACALADHVWVTSDNPRGEDPAAIIDDVVTGCSGSFDVEADRAAAIANAITAASAGDCVVIAGKGHEKYQLIEGEKRYFSDVEEAARALEDRSST